MALGKKTKQKFQKPEAKKSKNYSTPFMCSWDGETVKQGRQPTAGHETGGGNDGRMLWWSASHEKKTFVLHIGSCVSGFHEAMYGQSIACVFRCAKMICNQRFHHLFRIEDRCSEYFALCHWGVFSPLGYWSGNINMTVKLPEIRRTAHRRNLFCSLRCGWKAPRGRVEIFDWIHFMFLWWSAARLHDVDRQMLLMKRAWKAFFIELGWEFLNEKRG